jgi:hypothetical protein
MSEKINVTVEKGVQILEIREGKAKEINELIPVTISGTIDAPFKYLEKRNGVIDFNKAHLSIDRESFKISLKIKEDHKIHDTVTGSLKLTKDFRDFKINSGESWTHRELSQFIKMHRSCFESKDIAMKFSDQLRDLRVKVERSNQNKNDNRGNVRIEKLQAIKELNIPEIFNIQLEIFKGTGKKSLQVEIYIDPDDYSCQLISPDASDIIQEIRDSIIDQMQKEIKIICPDLVIIEE